MPMLAFFNITVSFLINVLSFLCGGYNCYFLSIFCKVKHYVCLFWPLGNPRPQSRWEQLIVVHEVLQLVPWCLSDTSTASSICLMKKKTSKASFLHIQACNPVFLLKIILLVIVMAKPCHLREERKEGCE